MILINHCLFRLYFDMETETYVDQRPPHPIKKKLLFEFETKYILKMQNKFKNLKNVCICIHLCVCTERQSSICSQYEFGFNMGTTVYILG